VHNEASVEYDGDVVFEEGLDSEAELEREGIYVSAECGCGVELVLQDEEGGNVAHGRQVEIE